MFSYAPEYIVPAQLPAVKLVNGFANLWLDDSRDPEEHTGSKNWTWVKTYSESLYVLKHYKVSAVSLDNDIADFYLVDGKTVEREGYHVVLWMIENDCYPESIFIHSANSVRAPAMRSLIERYFPEHVNRQDIRCMIKECQNV